MDREKTVQNLSTMLNNFAENYPEEIGLGDLVGRYERGACLSAMKTIKRRIRYLSKNKTSVSQSIKIEDF